MLHDHLTCIEVCIPAKSILQNLWLLIRPHPLHWSNCFASPRQKCRPGRLFCKINQLLLSRNHNFVVQHILVKSPCRDINSKSFLRNGVLEPLLHAKDAFIMSKDSLVRIQVMVCAYDSLSFLAIFEASSPRNFVHSSPSPPFVPKTRGWKTRFPHLIPSACIHGVFPCRVVGIPSL